MINTVADLIKILEKCPQEAEMAIYADGIDFEIDHVSIDQTHNDAIVWLEAFT